MSNEKFSMPFGENTAMSIFFDIGLTELSDMDLGGIESNYEEKCYECREKLLSLVSRFVKKDIDILLPAVVSLGPEGRACWEYRYMESRSGKKRLYIFSSRDHIDSKAEMLYPYPLKEIIQTVAVNDEFDGVIINPQTDCFNLPSKDCIKILNNIADQNAESLPK